MYQPIAPERSCARAWVAAASAILATNNEGYNVVIDVDNPSTHDATDNVVITLVDRFLKKHNENPIITVANTIFPNALYRAHGAPDFYEVYHRGFDQLSTTKRWGRYFERMTRHQTLDGHTYNPLANLIEKMRRQEAQGVRYSSAYELAVYDPLRDGRSLYGGQCLSFLSFKRHPELGLLLTALYRNHTYITRLLGNLIGLGRLQQFVADEVGIGVGSLTVVSTHAVVDAGKSWGLKDAGNLIAHATTALRRAVTPMLTIAR